MTKKPSKMHRQKTRVKAIHSSEPSARDEGPRLISLTVEVEEVPMSHYLQLADTALGTAAVRAPIKKTSSENTEDNQDAEHTNSESSSGSEDVKD